MKFSFTNVCRLLSIALLLPLVWTVWGAPSFLGYVVAFLAGHSVSSLTAELASASTFEDVSMEAFDALGERERLEIIDALSAGRRIDAIKQIRMHTGLDLLRAKRLSEAVSGSIADGER